ncbi:MAG TPA: hypothetical protein VFF04_04590 [Candidatus Babeliales bacterium]|nr:hypothetical protein [Candidatus Babeliales bacterium]
MKLSIMLADTFYDNVDPRRRQELKDSRMIQEDPRQMANLPAQPIHREYNQQAFNQSAVVMPLIGSHYDPMFDDEIGR